MPDMPSVHELAEADHIMGLHPAQRGGPDPDCGLCPKIEECPGCGKEYGNERELLRCFESHACYYCGGSIDRTHWNLTAGWGMLWCGCRDPHDEEA